MQDDNAMGDRPARPCYELTDQFAVSAPLERVWTFFADTQNLPKITPPWMRFTNDPGNAAVVSHNLILKYTMYWGIVPIRWRTCIIEWEPMRRFVDLQEKGPYALWWHEHRFEQEAERVVCWDRVNYRLPMGPIGHWVHAMKVKQQLIDIFHYRRKVIGQLLGGLTIIQPDPQVRETQTTVG